MCGCCVRRLAAKTVLAPKLGQFVRDYPDVVLEVTTDDSRDGSRWPPVSTRPIHFGEFIAQDMVAVRVSPDIRHAIVGAPSYFASHAPPTSPRDLLHHRCINFRHHGREHLQVGVDKGDESVAIAVTVPSSLTMRISLCRRPSTVPASRS